LFRDGDDGYDFYAVLSGQVAIVADLGRPDERVIGVHGARRFLGELNLLTGESVYLSARVVSAGAVLQVPAARLREIVAGHPSLGDLILRAYLARRALLIGLGTGPRVIGSRFSPDTRRLRVFLARNRPRTASSTSRRIAAPTRCCESWASSRKRPRSSYAATGCSATRATPSSRAHLGCVRRAVDRGRS
jgi:CRP-like cAMP-binding protein